MNLLIFALALLALILFLRILIPLGILLFIPSNVAAVRAMVLLPRVKPGEKTVDLGSGDGRIVMAFSRAGAEPMVTKLIHFWF